MSKFFSKLKGDKQDHSHLASPSSSSTFSSNNPYRYTQTQPPAYQAPSDPPPSHHPEKPSTSTEGDNPPPYHDWTAIPDTSLLPPPPPLTSTYSTSTNASYDEAAAAHAWCAAHPVFTPTVPHASIIENVLSGRNTLTSPPGASQRGWKLVPVPSEKQPRNTLGAVATSTYQILSPSNPASSSHPSSTSSSQPGSKPTSTFSRLLKSPANTKPPTSTTPTDQCWTSTLPLYFAATNNPLSPHFASPKPGPHTISFTITPLKYYAEESTVSIGLVSLPYPPQRQPGWHRASIGVHSDDGNRYVNDAWGGRAFTTPFREGETIGLALTIYPEPVRDAADARHLQSEREVRSPLPRCKTHVYVTRNGDVAGSWEMDEERDAERDEGVAGLSGECDLYAAVGTFGDVDVEIAFYAQGEAFVPPPPLL